MSDDIKDDNISDHNLSDGNTTLDTIINDVSSDIPEPQHHAIEAYKKSDDGVNDNSVKIQNDSFDASIHAVDKNNRPILTKTGKYRYKRGVKRQSLNLPNATPEKEVEQVDGDSLASAQVVQELKRSVYSNLFNFKYKDDLHKTHVDSTYAYFKSSGGVKLTPLQSLMILEGVMVAQVIKTPQSKDKLSSLKLWFSEKFIRFKRKKHAQSNSRTDTIGKDNTGLNDSEVEKV